MKKIAIITRTKNRPNMLTRAIKCVLSQTHTDFIHVIVNDTGDPNELDKNIAPYRHDYGDKILVIHRNTTSGMESASNIGIQSCESKWITLLDDDDTWEPHYLERMLTLAEDPPIASVEGVACWVDKVVECLLPDGRISIRHKSAFMHGHVSLSIYDLCQKNRILTCGFLYSRKAYLEVGAYDESFPVLGDWDFNLRFLEKFDIAVLPEVLAHYHVRPEATGAAGNSITQGLDLHRIYRATLLNKHFRRDLALGRPGLGMMLNSAASTQEAFDGWMAIVKVMKALFPYLPGKSWFLRG